MNPYEKELVKERNAKRWPLNEIKTRPELDPVKRLSQIPIKPKNVIRKITGSPLDHYIITDVLGKGAYGKVFKVKNTETEQIRAMKVISKTQLKDIYTEEDIENEIEILKNIGHPDIIKWYEFYSDSDNYYWLNEYCSEGELCKYWIEFKKFPEQIVKKLMYDIFSAVTYLHMNNIIHGDLKLENLMIDCNEEHAEQVKETWELDKNSNRYYNNNNHNNDKLSIENSLNENNADHTLLENASKKMSIYSASTFESAVQNDIEVYQLHSDEPGTHPQDAAKKLNKFDVKLIDFGCSKFFSLKNNTFQDNIGSLYYSSPEVLKHNYNEKCDIWSCGVIMYMLLSGEIPFNGATESEIRDRIINGRFCFYNRWFHNISYEAKDWMRKCFAYDPKNRISAKEALNHPFIKTDNFYKTETSKDNFEVLKKTKKVISSLLSFSNKSKFFQAVLTYLTHNFVKKKESNELKTVFLSIDTDMDGKISQSELFACWTKIGWPKTKEEVRNIMQRIDFDNDGHIDYPEFLQATISLKDLFTDNNLHSAFKWFDTHSDGTVSVRELEEILGLRNSTDKVVVSQLLKEINKTEEDEFTFEEFKMIIMQFVNDKADQENDVNNSEYKW